MALCSSVSNYRAAELKELVGTAAIKPAINQCSMHLGGHDDATIAFCKAHEIACGPRSPPPTPDQPRDSAACC